MHPAFDRPELQAQEARYRRLKADEDEAVRLSEIAYFQTRQWFVSRAEKKKRIETRVAHIIRRYEAGLLRNEAERDLLRAAQNLDTPHGSPFGDDFSTLMSLQWAIEAAERERNDFERQVAYWRR